MKNEQSTQITNDNAVEKVLRDEITGPELLDAIYTGIITDVGAIKESLQAAIDRLMVTDTEAINVINLLTEEARAQGDKARVAELDGVFRVIVNDLQQHIFDEYGPDFITAQRDFEDFKDFKRWCANLSERLEYSSLDSDSRSRLRWFFFECFSLAERYGTQKLDHIHRLFKIFGELTEIDIEVRQERETEAADTPAIEAMGKIIDALYEYRSNKGGGDQASLERARMVFVYERDLAYLLGVMDGKEEPIRQPGETDVQYTQRRKKGWRGELEMLFIPDEADCATRLIENEVLEKRRGPKPTPLSLAKKLVADLFGVYTQTVDDDLAKYKPKIERGEIPLHPRGVWVVGYHQGRRLSTKRKRTQPRKPKLKRIPTKDKR